MGKIAGLLLVIGGVAGIIYSWVCMQKERQIRLEECILFLQKSAFAMESEKMKVVDYFAKYISRDSLLNDVLHKIAKRLATNTYPDGMLAWEEVFKEEERNFAFDKESMEIVIQSGNGFFGRSREENICFLNKSIRELEKQKIKIKEKDTQERKVWVPVGMLGALMITILFI